MPCDQTLFKISIITIAIWGYSAAALSETVATDAAALETIHVDGDMQQQNIRERKIGEIKKTAQTLAKQQVQDSRDLVRYETGVSVVESGRFGSSGYAIRGVDENRVAITVDGLHQAETLSSQGFKELFEGYGNFNNTRNSVEIETLKQVSITKGANSVKAGSGALGGAVMFETKDARDFLLDKDYHIGYKTGYTTRDNQQLNTLTLAGRYKWFDALIIKTKRKGHELENYDYKYAEEIKGKLREKTDPYTIEKDSTLVKFSFAPNENHRLTVGTDLYENRSRGHDFSYNLNKAKTIDFDTEDLRRTNDKSKRKHYFVSYENYAGNLFWDSLKISYSDQFIKNRARTDEYCDGAHCEENRNPVGLQLKNGKIVDANGDPVRTKIIDGKEEIVDKNGNPFPYYGLGDPTKSSFRRQSLNSFWFDCSIFDCNSPLIADRKIGWTDNYEKVPLTLDKKYTDPNTGKTFASSSAASWKDTIIIPNSKGYLGRLWQERDLDTKSRQLNLDLTKSFTLLSTEHQVEYGGVYNRTKKQMVNQAGHDATEARWWTESSLGLDWNGRLRECGYNTNSYLCPKTDPKFSFLLPVKSKNGALYFIDKIKLNDYLGFDFGYRYDHIQYQPNYIPGVTPKLSDDMVKDLYIPLPPGKKNWMGSYDPPSEDVQRQNAIDNINYIAQRKKFKAHSYDFSTTFDPLDFLRVQARYAKGFRAPTQDEIYFTFKHPDFTILPNLHLEPEVARTREIALTLHHDEWGFVTAGFFRTKYQNFIDLVYLGQKNYKITNGGSTIPFSLYQNKNRQNAVVNGFEVQSKLELGKFLTALDGLHMSYQYTYQKGRMEGTIPMNAIQPRTSVYGLGYRHAEDIFGIDLFVTHVGRKNKEDTYNMYHKEDGSKDSYMKWRSDAYTMIDLIGYYKPIKNLTLQAGIYNLTDRKYITWESARSIKPFGTSNLIDQATGRGINRFYSPGRNFRLSAEIIF
ncbi:MULTISPECIES: TonB-dependent hemoglobin/transferrin/lactoferrin family receptor [Pasteurellaceae]|uniref:TonB-dependent hemoglobin/transferrin/lactoferrin family receptor n=1 Tax=Pasteurellaceae TaxID=712 RepID=UPI00356B6168